MLIGVALLFCASGIGAELASAKNPEQVEISANRMRLTRVAGGDFDDRLQKVQIEVIAKNLDYNRPANGLTLHYWVLAESLVNRKEILTGARFRSISRAAGRTRDPENGGTRHVEVG